MAQVALHPDRAQGVINSVARQSTHTVATAVGIQLMWKMSEPKTVPVPLVGLLHKQLPRSQQAKQVPWSWILMQLPRDMQWAESPKGPSRTSTAATSTATARWSSTPSHHRQCLSTRSHSLGGCLLPPSHTLPTQNVPAAQGTAQRTQTSLVS